MTITEKDRLDSIAFQNRMKTDTWMYSYVKEIEEVSNEYIDMIVCERLIGEEIIRCRLEEKGITSS